MTQLQAQYIIRYIPIAPQRPELTDREYQLLNELQRMRRWCLHYLEPSLQPGPQLTQLRMDMQRASDAISEATGGCDD